MIFDNSIFQFIPFLQSGHCGIFFQLNQNVLQFRLGNIKSDHLACTVPHQMGLNIFDITIQINPQKLA